MLDSFLIFDAVEHLFTAPMFIHPHFLLELSPHSLLMNCCVLCSFVPVCLRHMFEVEQSEYEKEQIDWSYIKFNDNKVNFLYSTVLCYAVLYGICCDCCTAHAAPLGAVILRSIS